MGRFKLEEKDKLINEANSNKSKSKEVYEDLTISIKDTGEGISDSLLNLINNQAIIKPNDKNELEKRISSEKLNKQDHGFNRLRTRTTDSKERIAFFQTRR